MKISVVSPVYNEQACVSELCSQLLEILPHLAEDFEIILVDDGSTDDSWRVISEWGRRYYQIRGIRFSRNFGHHYALTAGIHESSGDWVVVMDSDLQDSPAAIPNLLAKAYEGYDVVLARRENRQFGWFKNLCAKGFYSLFRYLTESRYDGASGIFRIMSRRIVEAYNQLPEVDRFFPALVNWLGFPQSFVSVTHGKRYAGETKYPFRKQIALAVNAMLSFSDKPIAVIVYFGLTVAALSILYAGYIALMSIFGNIVVLGYASLFTAVSFFGGMTMATLGLVGLYVGRIFRQVKGRPTYVVAERANAQQRAQTAAASLKAAL